MFKVLYPKLAAVNVRKNGKLFLPYIISTAFISAMLYIIIAIANNDGIMEIHGATQLKMMLNFGGVIIGIFSMIFLVYTNSFISKRRTSEFGLYSVLGMGKRHIATVLFFETFFVYIISMLLGFSGGILFNKLVTMLLCNILKIETAVKFTVSSDALIATSIAFACFFGVCFLLSMVKIGKSSVISMLSSKKSGEREPKTKWVAAILGAAFLLAGYGLAVSVNNALDALLFFFIAVICVIIGTYLLFFAGTVAVLKMLKSRPSYYYRPNHFCTVSGMIYRMKRNAAGLAGICILSTMVLVTVSTTVALYAGTEDMLNEMFPRDIKITRRYKANEPLPYDALLKVVESTAEKQNLTVSDKFYYSYFSFSAIPENGVFKVISNSNSLTDKAHYLCFMAADSYAMFSGKSISLADDEIAVNSIGEYLGDNVQIGALKFKTREKLSAFTDISNFASVIMNIDYIVVANDDILAKTYAEHLLLTQPGSHINDMIQELYVNVDSNDEAEALLSQKISGALSSVTPDFDYSYIYVECKSDNRQTLNSLYGSFLFIGLILGALFLTVTVMIIYYKQITEGYEDKERFETMKKVGMSRTEIRKTVSSQVLTVFILPLLTAFVHLTFAYPMIKRLLTLMMLNNDRIFLISLVCTCFVFLIIYIVVYTITSRAYYSIQISDNKNR